MCTPKGDKIIIMKLAMQTGLVKLITASLKLESDIDDTTVEGSLFHRFGIWQEKRNLSLRVVYAV